MLDNEADEISDDGTFSDLSNRPTTGHHNHHHQIVRLHQSREVKEFAVAVLKEASEAEWEDAELARLAVLIIKVLGLKYRAAWRLLNASCADMATATFLAQMKDEGLRTSAANVITILQLSRTTLNELVSKISECVEQHVLDVKDPETIALLVSVGEDSMNEDQRARYAAILCEHCDTKKQAGKVLCAFTEVLSLEEAASLVHSVVEFDFFLDLKGSMKSFFRQFGAVRQPLEERLQQMSEQAEQQLLRDEDEDDQGNLRGFVVDDDEAIIDSFSESEGSVHERQPRQRLKRKKTHINEPAIAIPRHANKRRIIESSDDDDDDDANNNNNNDGSNAHGAVIATNTVDNTTNAPQDNNNNKNNNSTNDTTSSSNQHGDNVRDGDVHDDVQHVNGRHASASHSDHHNNGDRNGTNDESVDDSFDEEEGYDDGSDDDEDYDEDYDEDDDSDDKQEQGANSQNKEVAHHHRQLPSSSSTSSPPQQANHITSPQQQQQQHHFRNRVINRYTDSDIEKPDSSSDC